MDEAEYRGGDYVQVSAGCELPSRGEGDAVGARGEADECAALVGVEHRPVPEVEGGQVDAGSESGRHPRER